MSRARTATSDSVESVPSAVTASRTTRSRATPSAKPAVASRAKTGNTARLATKNRSAPEEDVAADPQVESPTKPPTTASTATRLTSLKSRTVAQTKSDVSRPTTTTGVRTTSRVPASRTIRTPVTAKRETPKHVVNGEMDELAASMQIALTLNGNAKASSSKPRTATSASVVRQRVASGATISSNAANGNSSATRARTRIGAPTSEPPGPSAGSGDRKTGGSRTVSSSTSRPGPSANAQPRTSTPAPQTGHAGERLSFLPPNTLLRVKPEKLDLAHHQQARTSLNECITAFKAAQAEGYRYKGPSGDRTSEAGKASPTEDEKVKEWTDATMKVAVDTCCAVLRELTAHLLSGLADSHEWISDALTAVRMRMQIAKACSDFGLHVSSLRILIESRPIVLAVLGHESDQAGNLDSLQDVFCLPLANKAIEAFETREKLAIFSWLAMLWVACVTKANFSDKQDERIGVLEAIAALTSPVATSLLKPLDISRYLEIGTTKVYLVLMYTRIGKLLSSTPTVRDTTTDGNVTSHLLLLYALNASSTGQVTFSHLWLQTRRESERLANHGSGADTEESYKLELQKGAFIVKMIGDVVQTTLESSGSQLLKEWRTDKEWQCLMDFWLRLYRALGDAQGIEKVLNFMSEETTASPVATEADTMLDSGMDALTLDEQSGSSSFSGACGRIAKLGSLLDQAVSGSLSGEVWPLLRDTKPLAVMQRTCHGQCGEELLYNLGRIIRAIDRIRARLVKIIESAKQGQSTPAQLIEGSHIWLTNSFTMVEAILAGPCVAEEYQEQRTDLEAIALETAMSLSKFALVPADTESRETSLKLLLRAEKLFRKSRAPTAELQEWARCLSNAAWSCGAGIYRIEQFIAATPFIRKAIQFGDHALEILGPELSPATQQDWDDLRAGMSKRWEALSVCFARQGAKVESLEARLRCISAQSMLIPGLERESAMKPLSDIFDCHNKLAATLYRLSISITGDALFYTNMEEKMEERFFSVSQKTNSTALMAEYLTSCLQPQEYRPEVAGLIQALSWKAIGTYRKNLCPIRQVRSTLRLLEHLVATGAPIAEGEKLISECFVMLRGDLFQDRGLVEFVNQYEAELHMTAISIAYAARSPALSETLAQHADAARQNLLNLSGPRLRVSESSNVKKPQRGAIGGRSIKTPVSLKIDDRAGLCRRLDKFIGLLGMHDHAFRQVEFLRLKRGLERGDAALLNDFLATSARLASEYTRLGKFHRAGTIFESSRHVLAKSSPTMLSMDERVAFELRYALYLAAIGNVQKSEEIYSEIRRISQPEVPLKAGSSTNKIRQRCATLERAAMANLVLAEIANFQDNAVGAIQHRSIAFRLLSRAAENMARIAPKAGTREPKTPEAPPEDPFGPLISNVKPEDAPPIDDIRQDPKTLHYRGKQLVGRHLSLIAALLTTSMQLASDLLGRGSAKDALTLVKEAKSLAEIAGSQYWLAKTNCAMSEIHIALRDYEAAAIDIEESARILTMLGGPESVEAHRILAELQSRQVDTEEDTEMIQAAEQAFEATKQALKQLESSFACSDSLVSTPGKSMSTPIALTATKDAEDVFMAATRSRTLIEQARLLRRLDRLDESNELLEEARSGTLSGADDLHILGTTAFSAALSRFKSDLFLNSITESTISMPVGTVNMVDDEIRNDRNPIALTLQDAESAYQQYISLRGNAGDVTDVRDATVSIAMLRAYQASLGRNSIEYTRGAAALLDSSCSITLRRELMEILADGKNARREDEMVWPAQVSEVAAAQSHINDVDDVDHDERVGRRHQGRPDCGLFDQPDLSSMPDDWCAISINVTEDQTTMFISRSQRNRQPVIFTLPLDRQGKREEEEECFTLDAALTELRQIIRESDTTARGARDVDQTDKAAKTQWWADRKALDRRLQELLDSIEFCWLGAFKTIFNPACGRSPNALTAFRKNLEDTFARALNHGDKSKKSRIQLDDNIVECFSTLSSKSKDQEFEDLVYFILDLHQFNGVGVALAEIDIEQLSMDVQTALQQFEHGRRAESLVPTNNEHIFLILDRKVQEIPWESIPILRGRAVSRVPSLAFLADRLPPANGVDAGRLGIDTKKVFYILNPSKDLVRTQRTFEPWLKAMSEKSGWRGIIGREPTSLEIKTALQTYELVLYFGHGGMEQYIRTKAIRELPKCASVMIWGCSSGMLQEQGDLDRIGTPYNYMVAGAPSLTAVLWDITDAEIDKVAQSTSSQLRMDESHVVDIDQDSTDLSDSAVSNVRALSKARECCRLKYLTGAAPVVYGVPFYFR